MSCFHKPGSVGQFQPEEEQIYHIWQNSRPLGHIHPSKQLIYTKARRWHLTHTIQTITGLELFVNFELVEPK